MEDSVINRRFDDSLKLFERLKADSKVKFVESVDCALNLVINPKNVEENIKGVVIFPHDLGSKVKVAVFAKGEDVKIAEKAGADAVGCEDLVEEVLQKKGKGYDWYIATPDVVSVVAGKLARVLGPRGLMPNPKFGTVTKDLSGLLATINRRLSFKNDKGGVVHGKIGTVSLTPSQLFDNLNALLEVVKQLKPKSIKREIVKKVAISSTMGCSYFLESF